MSEQAVRDDPNASRDARWPEGPVEHAVAAARASGWEPGQPSDLSADDTATDRRIVRTTPCPLCRGACDFRVFRRKSDRRGYRALSVCRRCRNACEF
jgi:hypothetical protein